MSTLGNVDLCPAEVFKNKQALIMTMSGFFSQKKSLNIYDFVGNTNLKCVYGKSHKSSQEHV